MCPAGGGLGETELLRDHPRYCRIKDVGKGGYGQVLLAMDAVAQEHVALKFVPRGAQYINKYVEREIVNHIKLRHPHVIGLRDVFLTSTHLVLAMEYAPGGDLLRFVAERRGLGEDESRWFFQQIVIALDYCHHMGVSSRDIKLENTLLDDAAWPTVKLADFGLSKDADTQSAATSRVGTPAYLAPEVLNTRPGVTYDGQKADIWSCGVLLYTTLCNQYPFRRPTDALLPQHEALRLMMQRILSADFSFPSERNLSESVQNLLRSILVVDPARRPSLQDILAHPWTSQDLHPDALSYNEAMVQESLANLPSPELLQEVRSIVAEASQPLPARQQQQQQQQPAPIGRLGSGPAAPGR